MDCLTLLLFDLHERDKLACEGEVPSSDNQERIIIMASLAFIITH